MVLEEQRCGNSLNRRRKGGLLWPR